ncbi:MAG: response regulator [Magnetococcales bacterium]|nr:response regulator [Magnetococcales bacterium]
MKEGFWRRFKPDWSTPMGRERRRLLLRETVLALVLFGTAFWSLEALRFFDWMVEARLLFPEWRVGQVIPALIVALAGYVALVITRVHFLNRRLQAGERRLRFFIEHAPAAMAMFDREMRHLECGRRWRGELKLPEQGWRGVRLGELVPVMPPGWSELPGVCLTGESVVVREVSLRDADGREQWLQWSAHPWRRERDNGEEGEVGGVILFVEWITARKQVEAEARAREAAEAANQAKSAFLAVMSHEIRTPMSGIVALVDQMAAMELSRSQREKVELLQRSNEAMLAIINEILDFSRIEAGRMVLEVISFAPRRLFSDLESLFEAAMCRKGIGFRRVVDEALPETLLGDPLRVRQVLMNLLSNAVKFTKQGEIVLTVSVAALAPESCRVILRVEDSGIGMTPEHMEQLFTPYAQGDASVARRYGGSGLGLAICHRLVELMGGSIEASSHPGQGSVFVVALRFDIPELVPASLAGTGGVDPARGGMLAGWHSRRARLLVVDDDPLSQRLTEVMLRDWSAEVVCAGSGDEALQRVAEARFDLVLMDVRMPGMDGYEACRRIREWERLQGREQPLPIIALTGHVSSEDKERARVAGMSDHLEKPLRIRKLHDRLVRWLGPGDADAGEGTGAGSEAVEIPESAESVGSMSPSAVFQEEADAGEGLALLDVAVLEVLRRELSRVPDAFVNIVDMFLEDVPGKWREMRRLLASGDLEGISRAAHGMKSQCGAMGAVALRGVLIQVEQQAMEGRMEGLSALLDRGEWLFIRLVPFLKRIMAHPAHPLPPQ